MTDRTHIITALHALNGADVSLYSYAEHGIEADLEYAIDAAKRLVEALNNEIDRIKQTRKH